MNSCSNIIPKSILLKGDSNMTLEENKLLFDAVQQKKKVLTWKNLNKYICFTCILCI